MSYFDGGPNGSSYPNSEIENLARTADIMGGAYGQVSLADGTLIMGGLSGMISLRNGGEIMGGMVPPHLQEEFDRVKLVFNRIVNGPSNNASHNPVSSFFGEAGERYVENHTHNPTNTYPSVTNVYDRYGNLVSRETYTTSSERNETSTSSTSHTSSSSGRSTDSDEEGVNNGGNSSSTPKLSDSGFEVLPDSATSKYVDPTEEYLRDRASQFDELSVVKVQSNWNRYFVKVAPSWLKDWPEEVLTLFFHNCYRKSPNAVYMKVNFRRPKEVNNTFVLSTERAVDDGGLGRHFIAGLFKGLVTGGELTEGKLLHFTDNGDGTFTPTPKSFGKYNRMPSAKNLSDAEIREVLSMAYKDNIPSQYTYEDGILNMSKTRKLLSTFEGFAKLKDDLKYMLPIEKQYYMALGKLMGIAVIRKYPLGNVFSERVYKLLGSISTRKLKRDFDELNASSKTVKLMLQAARSDDKRLDLCLKYRQLLHTEEGLDNLQAKDISSIALALGIDADDATDEDVSEEERTLATIVLNSDLEGLKNAWCDLIVPRLDKEIDKKARQLAPLYYIARGIREHYVATSKLESNTMERREARENPWKEVGQLEAEGIQKKFQGVQSAAVILEQTRFDGRVSEPVQAHVRRWIEEATPAQLAMFLEAVTGSRSLGVDGQIRVDHCPDKKFTGADGMTKVHKVFKFHTCYSTIDVPNIEDYETFKSGLEKAILGSEYNMK